MTTPSDTSNYDCLPPWSNLDKKKEIFEIIIGRILDCPELGQKYVDHPEEARKDIGKLIQIPDDVKIVFLCPGDSETEGGGSVVIECPPSNRAELSFPEKMELFLCTYNPW